MGRNASPVEKDLNVEHLNTAGCCIRPSEGKGRGVFASRAIPPQTIIDISPILYFEKEEYEVHGKYTILDHFTFKCRDGRMALALGLGSIFNHSESPNVSYTIDTHTDTIRFMTTRPINSQEELCIFYGHQLWFEPAETSVQASIPSETEASQDARESTEEVNITKPCQRFLDDHELIPEDELPFTRVTFTQNEEEDMSTIRTVQAWVVDIPEPRLITTMLKWLKQSGLESSELGHLKRIRRQGEMSSLLLCTSPSPPELPSDIGLSEPYKLAVPLTAALTPTSLKLKSSLWPTVFAPRRKGEVEGWSGRRVKWAWQAVLTMVQEAARARKNGELPVVAHVPPPYEGENEFVSFIAHDTRNATGHPLRHAVMNVIRDIADHHKSNSKQPPTIDDTISVTPDEHSSFPRQGSNYLLTDTTLFTTHEPCIMCSMALLHSRVKEVIYLLPMEKTGGCGGLACLPRLQGVNHRFQIFKWKITTIDLEELQINPAVDP